jgi:S1-C subfamily serine protease
MKRTLLEISATLAVAVLFVSFQGQLTRLREETGELARTRVERPEVTPTESIDDRARDELDRLRHALLATVDERIAHLESRLDDASRTAEEASSLREMVRNVEQQTALFRAELERDVSRAFELVDSYQHELRAQARSVVETTSYNSQRLDQLRREIERDAQVLTEHLILPTVQLNGDDTVGSGTLIRSSLDPRAPVERAEVVNYVITSYHVVRNIFADTPAAKKDGVRISIYNAGPKGEKVEVRGDLVAHDARIDAALLKLRSTDIYPNVARVLSREEATRVQVWDDIYAIGCPLGNDPIPTSGQLSSVRNELGGANYWMINAPTYYGNSGGGVFTGDGRLALLGVFSKIYTHGRTSPVVVPHMGLCTPITEIYAWLDREGFTWVLEGETLDPRQLAMPGK